MCMFLICAVIFEDFYIQSFSGYVQNFLYSPDSKLQRSFDHGVVDIEENQLKKPYHSNYDVIHNIYARNADEVYGAKRSIPEYDLNFRSMFLSSPVHVLTHIVDQGDQIFQNNFSENKNKSLTYYSSAEISSLNQQKIPLFSPSSIDMLNMSPLDLQNWSYSFENPPMNQNNQYVFHTEINPDVNISQKTDKNLKDSLNSNINIEKKGFTATTIPTDENPSTSEKNNHRNKIDVRPPTVHAEISHLNSIESILSNIQIQHDNTSAANLSHSKHHKHHQIHAQTNEISLEKVCPDYLTPLERQLCIELTTNTNLTRHHKLAIINQMQRERISRYAVDRCQWRGRDCETCLMDMNCAYCPADSHCYDYSFAFMYLIKSSICYGFSPNYFMTCNVSFVKIFAIIVILIFLFIILIASIIFLGFMYYREKRKQRITPKNFVLNTEY